MRYAIVTIEVDEDSTAPAPSPNRTGGTIYRAVNERGFSSPEFWSLGELANWIIGNWNEPRVLVPYEALYA